MTTTTEAGPARTHVNGAVPARPTPPIRQRNVARIAIGTLVLVVSTLGVVALTAHTDETTERDQRIVYRVSLENGHFINLKMRDDSKSNENKARGEGNA